jgi:hypothetical protein
MVTATVSGVDFQVVPKTFKNTPVEATDLDLTFSVKVSEAGCYAIDVELYHNVSTSPFADPCIATSQRALKLPCQCFERDTDRKFQIAGSTPGVPPPGPDPQTPPRMGSDAAGQPGQGSGGTRILPPLKGTWPEDDTRWGNTLDVYAKINVISCHQQNCSGREPCLWILTRKLSDPVGSSTTDQARVEVIDGVGHDKAEATIFDAAKGGAGLIKLHSSIPSLHRDMRSIARRLDSIERQLDLKKEE